MLQKNGHWNIYLVAPWTRPTSGTKYSDVSILLPTGVSHNSQYSINVEPDGLSLKFSLVWPRHFTNLSTLTKIAKIHDPEVTNMHPLLGGITEAFKGLKASISDDIKDDYFIQLPHKVQPQTVFLYAKAPSDSTGKEIMSMIHIRVQGITEFFSSSVRDDGKIYAMTI